MSFVGTATEATRLGNQSLTFKALQKAIACNMRVCMPGIIKNFYPATQTVDVQITVYDKIKPNLPNNLNGYNPTTGDIKIPMLLDCPLLVERAGDYAMTLPVASGDECLVIFADMNINQWFSNGGTENIQQKLRRHSLSDGFAILAPSSVPKSIPNYQTNAMEMRNLERTKYIKIDPSAVTVQSDAQVDINGQTVIRGSLDIPGSVQPLVGSGNGTVTINVNGTPIKFVVQS